MSRFSYVTEFFFPREFILFVSCVGNLNTICSGIFNLLKMTQDGICFYIKHIWVQNHKNKFHLSYIDWLSFMFSSQVQLFVVFVLKSTYNYLPSSAVFYVFLIFCPGPQISKCMTCYTCCESLGLITAEQCAKRIWLTKAGGIYILMTLCILLLQFLKSICTVFSDANERFCGFLLWVLRLCF